MAPLPADRPSPSAVLGAAARRVLAIAGAPAEPATGRPPRTRDGGRHWPLWLAAGVAAGLLADGATLGLRHITGSPSLPESLQDLLVPRIDAATFARLLDSLGPSGKKLVLAGSLAGIVAVITGLGLLYGRLCRRGWRPGRLAATLWGIGTLANLAIFTTVLDANDRGGALWSRRLTGWGTVAAVIGVAAITLYLLVGRVEAASPPSGAVDPAPPAAASAGMTRRTVLGAVPGVAFALALGAGGLAAGLKALAGATNLDYEGRGTATFPVPDPITPTDKFYVVSKNLVDPSVDAGAWRLEVTGMVGAPVTLTLEDVRALPAVERIVTIECISNGVGGTLMSTARWRGPLLRDVIATAGSIDDGAAFAVITAVDGFDDSLQRPVALADDVLLALEMNGEPLQDRHGFPARIVLPGHYGEKQMKWLARIEMSDRDHLGFYQRQGYSSTGEVTTFSRIDNLEPDSRLPAGAPMVIRGHAFAGTRRVARVEISSDDGRTYAPAQLDDEISALAWRFFRFSWTPPAPGRYSLTVRATDGTGATQEDRYVEYVPRGASGLHRFRVTAV